MLLEHSVIRLQKLDADRDGVISYDDFMQSCLSVSFFSSYCYCKKITVRCYIMDDYIHDITPNSDTFLRFYSGCNCYVLKFFVYLFHVFYCLRTSSKAKYEYAKKSDIVSTQCTLSFVACEIVSKYYTVWVT